ncbi:MAG: alkaline phosphatase family protein [Verrucomicrobia bacterium]|nr:alkaline phosphatase family protein [Verrucomicrobiota bacterium]
MKLIRKSLFFSLIIPSFIFSARNNNAPPKLTIIFVCDATPKELLDKLDPFLTGGIKYLSQNGVNFINTFQPNANCSTTVGHASLMTGTFPIYHGMVNNKWYDANNNLIGPVQDSNLSTSGVFSPITGNVYGTVPAEITPSVLLYYGVNTNVYGVSPRNYKADTLSDQLVLNSKPPQSTKVFALAKDSLTATLMGGQMGQAFWLDGPTGLFTTSKYYYPSQPDWVIQFNQTHPVPPTFVWNPVYPLGSAAYNFPFAQDYTNSIQIPFVLPVNSTVLGVEFPSIVNTGFPQLDALGALTYITSPLGIKVAFDFAREIINKEYDNNGRLVLFFNIDSVDGLSGVLGSQTQDNFDTVYHIDQELGDFIKFVYSKVPRSQALFVFTSDEGYMEAMPELLASSGFGLAARTISNPPMPPYTAPYNLIDQFNTALGTNYCLQIIPPYLFLDLSLFLPLTPAQQATVLSQIKDLLRSTPGVKDAWTFDELMALPLERENLERYFKLALYRNLPYTLASPQERRSGEIVFQGRPYNLFTSDSSEDFDPTQGLDHTSPYNYDSHVPLFIYQHGRFARQTISDPVIMQQVPVSLSQILNVPRPSAAPPEVKPLPALH